MAAGSGFTPIQIGLPSIGSLPERDRGFARALFSLTGFRIVTLSMFQSIALFGFVLAFLGEPTWFLPFGAAAIALMAMDWPSLERWYARAQSALDGG